MNSMLHKTHYNHQHIHILAITRLAENVGRITPIFGDQQHTNTYKKSPLTVTFKEY